MCTRETDIRRSICYDITSYNASITIHKISHTIFPRLPNDTDFLGSSKVAKVRSVFKAEYKEVG